jgi:hypothetical protein
MDRAPSLEAPVGLLPLPRPLMSGEVLDGGFRLFRAGLLRCLPYSGVTVLALELPALYSTFAGGGPLGTIARGSAEYYLVQGVSLLLGIVLLGLLTVRLAAISRGLRPRFRAELPAVLKRWPAQVLATSVAMIFPAALVVVGTMLSPFNLNPLLLMLELALYWPAAFLVVSLPAFWCDGFGPFAAIAQSVRISRRRTWRMVGILMACTCVVLVFFVLAAVTVGLLAPLIGSAVFLISAVRSIMWLVAGAFGVPLVLAVLIVAYEDLKLRDAVRREARS